MEKLNYQTPDTELLIIETEGVIAQSGGFTGGDLGDSDHDFGGGVGKTATQTESYRTSWGNQ